MRWLLSTLSKARMMPVAKGEVIRPSAITPTTGSVPLRVPWAAALAR